MPPAMHKAHAVPGPVTHRRTHLHATPKHLAQQLLVAAWQGGVAAPVGHECGGGHHQRPAVPPAGRGTGRGAVGACNPCAFLLPRRLPAQKCTPPQGWLHKRFLPLPTCTVPTRLRALSHPRAHLTGSPRQRARSSGAGRSGPSSSTTPSRGLWCARNRSWLHHSHGSGAAPTATPAAAAPAAGAAAAPSAPASCSQPGSAAAAAGCGVSGMRSQSAMLDSPPTMTCGQQAGRAPWQNVEMFGRTQHRSPAIHFVCTPHAEKSRRALRATKYHRASAPCALNPAPGPHLVDQARIVCRVERLRRRRQQAGLQREVRRPAQLLQQRRLRVAAQRGAGRVGVDPPAHRAHHLRGRSGGKPSMTSASARKAGRGRGADATSASPAGSLLGRVQKWGRPLLPTPASLAHLPAPLAGAQEQVGAREGRLRRAARQRGGRGAAVAGVHQRRHHKVEAA